MSESDDLARRRSQASSLERNSMLAIEVSGKDPEIWEKRQGRFYDRIVNSIKKLLGADIPSGATVSPEVLDALDALAEGAIETLKTPQLKNLERQASIKVKLAEAREREAAARKIELEADKLQMERDGILASKRIIDLMIQRGELAVVESDGELVFVLNESRNKMQEGAARGWLREGLDPDPDPDHDPDPDPDPYPDPDPDPDPDPEFFDIPAFLRRQED